MSFLVYRICALLTQVLADNQPLLKKYFRSASCTRVPYVYSNFIHKIGMDESLRSYIHHANRIFARSL